MSQVPSHVPDDLVRDYSPSADPAYGDDPWKVFSRMHDELPDIYWTTAEGGHWVVTRAEGIREVLQNPGLFSSKNASRGGFPRRLIPIDTDAPEHTEYRNILNPTLSPKSIDGLDDLITEITVGLIDKYIGQGECEFLDDVAKVIPTTIFTKLMGLPLEQHKLFLRWVDEVLHNRRGDDQRMKAGLEIVEFLDGLVKDRKKEPKDDIVSTILAARVNDKPLTDEEVMDYCFLLFIGGLDTLASLMGYTFYFFSRHPEQRKLLVENPDRIPDAIEEMLRMHSIITTNRTCTKDLTLGGVQMKEGDDVSVNTALASLDPREFKDPLKADFDRSPNRHLALSSGPHRCLGSHLARRELRILLEQWFKRIPDFEVKPGAKIRHHLGVVGLDTLPLVWKPTV